LENAGKVCVFGHGKNYAVVERACQ
jgi:hypothetical protein